MNKRLLLFIATEKGYTALQGIVDKRLVEKIGAVITFKETNVTKCWDNEIQTICCRYSIPFFWWSEVKDSLFDLIRDNNITGAVTISWKYLLPLSINEVLEDNLIVLHDSLLPKYRGFAPTPTAIICGEKEIGVTAIFATEQVDRGDIVMQRSVMISDELYIEEIIRKQAELCADILQSLICKMENGNMIGRKQDENMATYSIWRNPEDCYIDWNWSAKKIYNFVRALGSPYPGAYTYLDGQKIRIIKSEIIEEDLDFVLRDCGKIWSISDGKPEIVCGEGMIRICSAIDESGKPVQFKRVRCRLS